jgi:arylsulfatase A-like enzyme
LPEAGLLLLFFHSIKSSRLTIPLLIVGMVILILLIVFLVTGLGAKNASISLMTELPRATIVNGTSLMNMEGTVPEHLHLTSKEQYFLHEPDRFNGSTDGYVGIFKSPLVFNIERWQITNLTFSIYLSLKNPIDKVRIKLNGKPISEETISPGSYQKLCIKLPNELLLNGENNLEFSADSNEMCFFIVDWVRLDCGDQRAEDCITEDIASLRNQETPEIRFNGTSELDFHLKIPAQSHLQMDIGNDSEPSEHKNPRLSIVGSKDGRNILKLWEGEFPQSANRHLDLDLSGLGDSVSAISLMVTSDSADTHPYVANLCITHPTQNQEPAPTPASSAEPHPRTIVLILEDACRRDFTSLYGNPIIKTPHLEELARNATVFDNAYARSSWTMPSVAAMFTGQPYTVSGVVNWYSPIRKEVPTIAEILTQNHWRTAIITSNFFTGDKFSISRGFENIEYIKADATNASMRTSAKAGDLVEPCQQWIASLKPDERAFLFVHLMDTHEVYYPPPPYREFYAPQLIPLAMLMHWFEPEKWNRITKSNFAREFIESLEAEKGRTLTPQECTAYSLLYDSGAVTYFDDTLPRFINILAHDDRLKDAVFIVCSDHGEEFLDHGGTGHGETLYQELIRVVLMAWGEGIKQQRVSEQVGLIDLAPTILDLAGVAKPQGLRGNSLLPVLMGGRCESSPQFSATSFNGRLQLSVVDGDWKLLGCREFLFNLKADPYETHNVADDNPVMLEYLRGLIRAYYGSGRQVKINKSGAENLSQDVQDALRGMGYIQ